MISFKPYSDSSSIDDSSDSDSSISIGSPRSKLVKTAKDESISDDSTDTTESLNGFEDHDLNNLNYPKETSELFEYDFSKKSEKLKIQKQNSVKITQKNSQLSEKIEIHSNIANNNFSKRIVTESIVNRNQVMTTENENITSLNDVENHIESSKISTSISSKRPCNQTYFENIKKKKRLRPINAVDSTNVISSEEINRCEHIDYQNDLSSTTSSIDSSVHQQNVKIIFLNHAVVEDSNIAVKESKDEFLPNESLSKIITRNKYQELVSHSSNSNHFAPKLKPTYLLSDTIDNSISEMRNSGKSVVPDNCVDKHNELQIDLPFSSSDIIETKSTGKIKYFNPVPLRNVNSLNISNDSNKFLSNKTIQQGTNKDYNSQDHWRDRIWPTKAIYSFTRLITGCIPQLDVPKSGVFDKTNVILPHWKELQLKTVTSNFDSISSLTSTFVMLIAEECRQCICQDVIPEDVSLSMLNVDESYRNNISKSMRWSDAEIECVVNESEMGGLPLYACDNKSSSVWNIKVVLKSNQDDTKSYYYDAEFSNGDLLYITCEAWNRPLLGIVQGFDPDENSLNGYFNNSKRNRSNSSASIDSKERDNNIVDSINILICVSETRQQATNCGIGGWADPGMIINRLQINLTILGNTLTFIRECQALVSLRYINPKLIDNIITSNSESKDTKSNLTNHNTNCSYPLLWEKLRSVYNDSQLDAIKAVMRRRSIVEPSILLLKGPPGTGKTHTILGILSVLLTSDVIDKSGRTIIINNSKRSLSNNLLSSDSSIMKPRILICAPSNTAVDELVYRLHKQGVIGFDGERMSDLSIVRVGHISKRLDNNERKRNLSNSNTIRKDLKSIIEEVVEALSLETLVENKKKYLLTSDSKAKFTLSDIRKSILDQADIVCCTLSGAGSQALIEVVIGKSGFKFDAVIIDECAQCTEPSTLIPFKFDPHMVIMVGDPCQLPAVLMSKVTKNCNYHQSLFERLQNSGNEMIMLNTQYRMHPYIADFPSYRYYNNELLTDSSLIYKKDRILPYYFHSSNKFKPFMFHNIVKGLQTNCNKSYQNLTEALHIVEIYQELKRSYPNHVNNIGIIAPYSAQRQLIKNLFNEKFGYKCNVEISTIDGFQGREKDIIIFSCVRAPSKANNFNKYNNKNNANIGFLREKQVNQNF